MEAVVLHRVGFLEYFCPKQGQDFKPSAAPLYPNMGQVFPPRARQRAVRRAYKGHVTQNMNKAERLMSGEDDESEELTAIFEISRRENEITALDSSIVNLLESEDDIARDVEETLTLQDRVSVIKTRITKYIQNKNPPVRSNQNASHAPSTNKRHVSLPKMTITPFHGDPLE